MTSELARQMSDALDTRAAYVRTWQARYRGLSPFVLLTAAQREQLADRIASLSINFEALAVDLLAERLRLTGFLVNGSPDLDLWERWQDMGMVDGAAQVTRDALATGQGFASVWGDEFGDPVALPESPTQCIVKRDPVSRRAVIGFKRWNQDKRAHGALYLPDRVHLLRSRSYVPEDTAPSTGWEIVRTAPNPLGAVPLVDVTNVGLLTDPYGVSELAPLADPCDALRKVMLDALISSHESGTPRRWSTGVDIEEDEEGNAVDPWAGGTTTVQAADAAAKFGQFSAADLAGYRSLTDLLTSQVGALSGLPPQVLGMHADQATSADAIRAAEATLVAKAEARQETFGRAWGQVAALLVAVRDGGDPRRIKVTPVWGDPGTRSTAQEADAAVKLHAEGLLSTEGTQERIGLTPPQIANERRRLASEIAIRQVMAP